MLTPKLRAVTAFASVAAVSLALGFWLGTGFAPKPAAPLPTPSPAPAPAPAPAAAHFSATSYAALEGWAQDSIAEALPALKASCALFAKREPASMVGEGAIARTAQAWQTACARLNDATGDAALRAALESAFEPYTVASDAPDGDRGTFTGYYEAELRASLTPDARYRVPIYGVPRDLVAVDLKTFVPTLPSNVPRQIVGRVIETRGRPELAPYFSREEIDSAKAVAERADVLLWADDPVAVHILHIQGSGRATLPDGKRLRVGFAGSNGRQFQGIGGILLKEGVLKSGEATMDKVRDWLTKHPTEAETYMNRNTRYIFFQLRPDTEASGPIGSQGVALTAGRSLAVDASVIPLGAPLWLDTVDPDGRPLRRLMVAQDTGAAIVGAVRGDYYWGTGEPAFAQAARMRSPGRYAVLVPR